MRPSTLAAIIVALAVLVVGMPKLLDAGEPRNRADAAEETREALQAYRASLQDELDRLGERLAELEDKARAGLADARPETKERLEKLRQEHTAARRALDDLSAEAERAWDGIRSRMDRVIDDLQRKHDGASASP